MAETLLVGPVVVALANPGSARSLTRLGMAMAAARGSRLIVAAVVPLSAEGTAQAGATRLLRGMVHRMIEMSAAAGHVALPMVRAARGVVEGLTEIVRDEGAGLLVVGWPAPHMGNESLGLVGLLAAGPPCELLIVRGRVGSRWRKVMLSQRGGAHTLLAGEVALALAATGELARQAGQERSRPVTLTALHVLPDYLPEAAAAIEEAAFAAYWTREQPAPTRPLVVRGALPAEQIARHSRGQDLLVLDAAPTARPYPFPLGRSAHEVIATASATVVVAKSPPPPRRAYAAAPAAPLDLGAAMAPISAVDRWFAEHTFGAREFANAAELAALKDRLSLTVSVLLLASEDEETIGPLLQGLRGELGAAGAGLVDEYVVVDSGSGDATREIARGLGVPALDTRELLRGAGSYRGRGDALWKALSMVAGDLVVCLNATALAGAPRAVLALLGPLLHDQRLRMVTGFSRRSLRGPHAVAEGVAETVVRPLLNLVFPELAGLVSPLPSDFAARRATLRRLPLATGEGLELGLLLDVLRAHGLDALAQADLEARPLRTHSPQAASRLAFGLAQVILRRLDAIHTDVQLLGPVHHVLRLPHLYDDRLGLDRADVLEIERPPLDDFIGGADAPSPIGR